MKSNSGENRVAKEKTNGNSKYIIFFGRFELPDKNALAHRVRSNAYALSYSGYKPILVGYARGEDANQHYIDDRYIPIECYTIEYPRTQYLWLFENGDEVIKRIIVEKGSQNIKAIVFNGVGYRNIKRILQFSSQYSIPCVYDVVDWFPYSSRTSIRDNVKRLEDNLIRRRLLGRIKNYIFISSYLNDLYFPKAEHKIVIPSLTAKKDKRFSDLPHYVARDEITYCYVGSPGLRGSKERLDWCVEAFMSVAAESSKLLIYGITKEEYLDYYHQIDVDQRVIFMGRRPNRECVLAIAEADFFVFAREDTQVSRAGFPTKFSESFAIGTPVITTPTSDLGKYIIDGKNGILSKECTYDSYLQAFSKSASCSVEDRKSMRILSSPLDEECWRIPLSSFVNSLK
ncbi:MAG: glycosyltransferase family 4 protein [Prolixibacteraceae bacterium]|nr:glycosyltransferase family 4 protein [Prolixibacteraceae bacterium]